MSSVPLIGIEVDLEASATGRRYSKCYESYFDAVVDAGGAPVLLAPCPPDRLRHVLARVDGVVVPGGDDFSAEDWGEVQRACPRFVPSDTRRLETGRALMELVLAHSQPYLGICYGMQLMNVALGGALVQDILDEIEGPLPHREPHGIEIEEGSLLGRLSGGGEIQVNSRHHQAVREAGRGLTISARAPDGVVEAIEGAQDRFLLGVQWHAEELGRQPGGLPLFEGLVAAAAEWALVRDAS